MNGKGSGNCGHWVALDEFFTQGFFLLVCQNKQRFVGGKKNTDHGMNFQKKISIKFCKLQIYVY
jgi:hypothetical protein